MLWLLSLIDELYLWDLLTSPTHVMPRIQPYVTMTRGKCRVSCRGHENPFQLSFYYFCFSLIPPIGWTRVQKWTSPCDARMSKGPFQRERESLVFAVFGSGLRLIFTGPIWAGIFDPLNTFQGGLLEEYVAFTMGNLIPL